MSLEDETSDFQSILEAIFQLSPEKSNRITSRESTTVEFKASFHKNTNKWDEYGKTIAAFANTKGGCLVFGVKNKPHDLIGLSNDYFDEFDPAQLTSFLNGRFSPEIGWSKHTHAIEDKKFGLIRVYECPAKPIVAISNGGNHIKEAEIYYRYRGRSEKIKYPELKKILEEVRKIEQQLWMKHLRMIASIGVSNAAIFNPDDGTVTGKSGAFVIDRNLLPKLHFIREGEFREVTGAPTIRIVGDAKILAAGDFQATEFIVERQSIRAKNIVEFFLLQKKPDQPIFFLEQVCHEPTGYLPIYYFAQLASITREKLRELVIGENSSQQGKKKLLDRLETRDNKLFENLPSTSSASAMQKQKFRQDFLSKSVEEPTNLKQLNLILCALRNLKKSDIEIDYVFPFLRNWYEQYWEEGGGIRTNLYKTISHLDKECFCPDDFYSAS